MLLSRAALLSAATLLLLLLLPEPLAAAEPLPIHVVVRNSLQGTSQSYTTHVVYRGILIGGLRRLMNDSNSDFKFTSEEHPDYGPFLQSVNGLAGNPDNRTYWELLVRKANGTIVRPDVGIGCYIPSENEQIILNFTTW